MLITAEQHAAERSERILNNVVWSGLGVAFNVLIGILLAPFIVRRVGAEGFGIWTLVLGMAEYSWLLDFGFRSATVRFSARYWATNEPQKLNEVINTGLVYFSCAAIAILIGTISCTRYITSFFRISPAYTGVVSDLVLMVGCMWAMSVIFNVFAACIEGFQRFDVANRIAMLTNAVRLIGMAAVLFMGYGLRAMGLMLLLSQMLNFALSARSFGRLFPALQLSPRMATVSAWRSMASYGIHAFVGITSRQSLNQTVPLLIGHYLPTAFVAYYNVPGRLLQYAADVIFRMGMVTGSSTTEMVARGENRRVLQLGIYANRYCLTLFFPVAIVLIAYGREIIQLWLGPDIASQSAPILPVLVIATTIGIAGQLNSGSILLGLAKHRGYARGLFAEALLSFVSMLFVIPRYGILGAAWVTSVLIILNRGLLTAWLVSRRLDTPLLDYLIAIYVRPSLAALPVICLSWFIKADLIRGHTWLEVVAASVAIASIYYALSFFICVNAGHRTLLVSRLRDRQTYLATGGFSQAE
jgi:O-antigen/teichoic acid export membrane protein